MLILEVVARYVKIIVVCLARDILIDLAKDVATIHVDRVDGHQQLRLVCDPDGTSLLTNDNKSLPRLGYSGGGENVNEKARAWLGKEHPSMQWNQLSSNFDKCKRMFDGENELNLTDRISLDKCV